MGNTFLQDESFNILIGCHQKYYPADKNLSLYPFCDDDELMKARLRLSDTDGAELRVSNHPVIVSHRDYRLSWLLISHAHVVNVHLGHPAHLNATLTLARLRQSPYSVHLTRAAASVKQFIGTCPLCLRYLSHPDKVGLGSPRKIRYLKNNYYPFSVVSCDQLGPFERSVFVKSRKQVKYYILLIVCGLSSAVNSEILEDNTRRSITQGLYLHSQRYIKPRVLICDAGSSVNPNPGSETYRHFFGDHPLQVHQVPVSHQALNFCEATAKRWKRVVKTALLTRKNVHLPSLSFTQVRLMLESVNFLFNSQPISVPHSEESFITPLHLIRLDYYETGDNNLLSGSAYQFSANLNLLRESLGNAVQIFTRTLKQILLSTTRSHLRRYPKSNPFQAEDIVLFLKHSKYVLCKVTEVKPQYCTVITAERVPAMVRTVHCSLLVLVYRPGSGCRAFTDQLRDENGDDNQSVALPESEGNIFYQFFPPVLGQHTPDAGVTLTTQCRVSSVSPTPTTDPERDHCSTGCSSDLRHPPGRPLTNSHHRAPDTCSPRPSVQLATKQHNMKVEFMNNAYVQFVRLCPNVNPTTFL